MVEGFCRLLRLEINDDHREFDPELRNFNKSIRLQLNQIKCEIMREIISETFINEFWDSWRQNDLIVARKNIVRDMHQMKLFDLQKEKLVTFPVPLCYRTKDTRRRKKKLISL